MSDIVLTTLNARYAHASFGLRYLMANLGELQPRATILEFDINLRVNDALEAILAKNPRVVGVGVYIWNAVASLELVSALKRCRPDIVVVIGGPEVSHEIEQQEICRIADYVIAGEADLAFATLCRNIFAGRRPLMRVINAPPPHFDGETPVALPYDFYSDTDIAQRVVYVEASRGCPFSCEFCLSSLEVPVRNVPLERFLGEMQKLYDRGCRAFKFVDRTFNLNLTIGKTILQFFLDRYVPGLFVHFEMIPDRLPAPLREIIAKFPPGALQFEVGIQTFNPAVEKALSRRQDHARLVDNLTWLREHTGVHVHADLIVGLPGEDVASFGRGFDQLVALGPEEIQVGILKRLRGTPIIRHDAEWGMVYAATPPYEVLQTKLIDFATMQTLRRFSRYWDLVANSGNFLRTTKTILSDAPFENFCALSEWIWQRTGNRTSGIALSVLAELLFGFLTDARGVEPALAAQLLIADFDRVGREPPSSVLTLVLDRDARKERKRRQTAARQSRHLAQ